MRRRSSVRGRCRGAPGGAGQGSGVAAAATLARVLHPGASVVWALHNVHNLFIMSIIQELFQKLWTLHNLLCKTIIYYVKP
jgi:hypothetical protein